MAIPVGIEALLRNGVVESTRIEYKESFNPDSIIRTICAFANDIDNIGGGYIIIGVEEENGVPRLPAKGVEKSSIDATLKKLREYYHFIEPFYEPEVEPVLLDEAWIIAIWVPGGYGRPYKAPKSVFSDQSVKHYYIRRFSSTVIASSDEEKELFYVSSNIPFDDRPNFLAEVSDLDVALMREHLHETESSLYKLSEGMDVARLAQDMQLLGGPPERLKPLNVGILMFSEHPERYFRYARIEVVDIPDPTGNNMIERIFTGPVQRQLRDALLFIRNYVIKEAVLKVPDDERAIRIKNYPMAAIEEILSNAVYHRSYQIHEPITVRITPAGIEITSFPGFDRSITDSAIEKGDIRARVYRNRRIGDYLRELHLIEGRNTDYQKARRALSENGSGDLVIEMNEERDYLSVTIPVHSYFRKETVADSEYGRRILSALSEGPLSLTDLAYRMGYKGISARLRNNVEALMNEGHIRRTLSMDGKPQLSVR